LTRFLPSPILAVLATAVVAVATIYFLTFMGNRRQRAFENQLPDALSMRSVADRVGMSATAIYRYFENKERCLICDLLTQERATGTRVVMESDRIIALCPFASRFPFELWILPKRHHCDFSAMQSEEVGELAVVMQQVIGRLRTVLNDPPYNYLLHTAPFRHQRGQVGHWKTILDDFHWHIELIPRLTRVAGFEWGSGFYINPTPPEEAAKYLREAVVEPVGVKH